MLFLKDKNPVAKPPKHPNVRSALGLMFNPDIGSSLQPLRETTDIFINLLALIFASQGMFPRNHPALNGVVGARLTLSDVLGAAWRGLSFTKKTVPQVLLFFAVIASLVFSVLAVLALALSLFVGKAHATTFTPSSCGGGGYFSPCDSTQDIALSWINYLFNGNLNTSYIGQYGQILAQSSVIQTALISALAFYSDAILIVAAVILFYHLVSMVVETAHHGVVMGKRANQIWAPIRLVVAIGLLVPIAGGLNSGQYIVINVAEWGSNLASQVWSVFVNQLAAMPYNGVTATAPYARRTVYDTVVMEACMAAYNCYAGGGSGSACNTSSSTTSSGPPPINTSIPGLNPTIAVQGPVTLDSGATKYIYDVSPSQATLADAGVCGHYIFPPPQLTNDTLSSTFQTSVQQTSQTAFQAMQNAARTFAQQYVVAFVDSSVGGQGDAPIPQNTGGFEQIVKDYQTALQNDLAGASTDFGPIMTSVANTSAGQGWVSAGAWFNTVARAQTEMMDTSALIPSTQEPTLKPDSSEVMRKTFRALGGLKRWLANEQPTGSSSATSQQDQLMLAAAGFQQENTDKTVHYMDVIFAAIDWVASWNHVWKTPYGPDSTGLTPNNFTLGVQFATANPLAEIAALGHANINTAYDLFDMYINWSMAGGLVSGEGAGQEEVHKADRLLHYLSGGAQGGGNAILKGLGSFEKGMGSTVMAIGTIFSFASVAFFTAGFMLAFFLPLIPFFRFLFNVITWIVSLLEAIVCVPLIALAHLNPEGEGLPGATGKAAYHFIFSIFLRPVLMIFGLILGLMIFYIAASYMNLLYMQAVAGAGGISHGHLTLARLVYSILYVVVLYMAANSSFKMISWLPEHAAKWMGAQQMHWQQMGDPSELSQPLTIASGYVDQRIAGAVGGAAGKGAQGLGQFAGSARGVLGGIANAGVLAGSAAILSNGTPSHGGMAPGMAAAAGRLGVTNPDGNLIGGGGVDTAKPAAITQGAPTGTGAMPNSNATTGARPEGSGGGNTGGAMPKGG